MCFTKQAILMWMLIVLNIPLQLVFPDLTDIKELDRDKHASL
jgi:hypothetical protein